MLFNSRHPPVWILVVLIILLHTQASLAQADHIKKKSFYFAIGTNFSYFSRSDIHLKNSQTPFDFTLYNVRGRDDRGIIFNHGAPQYSYVLGYYNRSGDWGIEFNFDHIKYYMVQNQRVRMEGVINNKSFNTDTTLVSSFVMLEHTDGANYALLKLVKRMPINDYMNGNRVDVVFKSGLGPVIPKTNSTIMGQHRDDRYNIAGYVVALESGIRYSFREGKRQTANGKGSRRASGLDADRRTGTKGNGFKRLATLLFLEADVKSAYANYKSILIANGTGSQQWFALHFNFMIGVTLEK